jgi:hypothetical protein
MSLFLILFPLNICFIVSLFQIEKKGRMEMDNLSLNMILKTLYDWSYDGDKDLYKSLQDLFGESRLRGGVNEEQRKILFEANILKKYTIIELFQQAIGRSDFQDTIKFGRLIQIMNDKNLPTDSSMKPQPYSVLTPDIGARNQFLRENGLDDWHKSLDHEKHGHFRYWMNYFLTENKHFSLRFFIVNTGNTRCFDTLHIGSNESEAFNVIFQYILNENICPDPHQQKIEVPDFVNPDNYNQRYINYSGRFGGFWYLVYLTGKELKEIYKTKINKRKLNYMEKAYWGFINSTSLDKETKFFLFIT